jgi:lipid-A-disaccharide synthase
VDSQGRPYNNLHFFGGAGERMRAAGCRSSLMPKTSPSSASPSLSHLPIYGLFRKLIRAADDKHPKLAIVIDSPAFNWRVARQMRKRGIPVVYYVCPQFWAWRQGRVKLLRKYINQALVIFPFEENFYRVHGVNATFVGHPLADLSTPEISRMHYAAQQALDHVKPWITPIPGRRKVRMNLPTILEAAGKLGQDTISSAGCAHCRPSFLKELIGNRAFTCAGGYARAPSFARWHHREQAATVESAMMGPFVMVYRVSPLTYVLGKPRQGSSLRRGQPDCG